MSEVKLAQAGVVLAQIRERIDKQVRKIECKYTERHNFWSGGTFEPGFAQTKVEYHLKLLQDNLSMSKILPPDGVITCLYEALSLVLTHADREDLEQLQSSCAKLKPSHRQWDDPIQRIKYVLEGLRNKEQLDMWQNILEENIFERINCVLKTVQENWAKGESDASEKEEGSLSSRISRRKETLSALTKFFVGYIADFLLRRDLGTPSISKEIPLFLEQLKKASISSLQLDRNFETEIGLDWTTCENVEKRCLTFWCDKLLQLQTHFQSLYTIYQYLLQIHEFVSCSHEAQINLKLPTEQMSCDTFLEIMEALCLDGFPQWPANLKKNKVLFDKAFDNEREILKEIFCNVATTEIIKLSENAVLVFGRKNVHISDFLGREGEMSAAKGMGSQLNVFLFAGETLFVDRRWTECHGKVRNLLVFSSKLKCDGTGRSIHLFGADGLGRSPDKDKWKAQDGQSWGESGQDGADGRRGGRGGNVMIITKELQASPVLTVCCQGGLGGSGQNGGDGHCGYDNNARSTLCLKKLKHYFENFDEMFKMLCKCFGLQPPPSLEEDENEELEMSVSNEKIAGKLKDRLEMLLIFTFCKFCVGKCDREKLKKYCFCPLFEKINRCVLDNKLFLECASDGKAFENMDVAPTLFDKMFGPLLRKRLGAKSCAVKDSETCAMTGISCLIDPENFTTFVFEVKETWKQVCVAGTPLQQILDISKQLHQTCYELCKMLCCDHTVAYRKQKTLVWDRLKKKVKDVKELMSQLPNPGKDFPIATGGKGGKGGDAGSGGCPGYFQMYVSGKGASKNSVAIKSTHGLPGVPGQGGKRGQGAGGGEMQSCENDDEPGMELTLSKFAREFTVPSTFAQAPLPAIFVSIIATLGHLLDKIVDTNISWAMVLPGVIQLWQEVLVIFPFFTDLFGEVEDCARFVSILRDGFKVLEPFVRILEECDGGTEQIAQRFEMVDVDVELEELANKVILWSEQLLHDIPILFEGEPFLIPELASAAQLMRTFVKIENTNDLPKHTNVFSVATCKGREASTCEKCLVDWQNNAWEEEITCCLRESMMKMSGDSRQQLVSLLCAEEWAMQHLFTAEFWVDEYLSLLSYGDNDKDATSSDKFTGRYLSTETQIQKRLEEYQRINKEVIDPQEEKVIKFLLENSCSRSAELQSVVECTQCIFNLKEALSNCNGTIENFQHAKKFVVKLDAQATYLEEVNKEIKTENKKLERMLKNRLRDIEKIWERQKEKFEEEVTGYIKLLEKKGIYEKAEGILAAVDIVLRPNTKGRPLVTSNGVDSLASAGVSVKLLQLILKLSKPKFTTPASLARNPLNNYKKFKADTREAVQRQIGVLEQNNWEQYLLEPSLERLKSISKIILACTTEPIGERDDKAFVACLQELEEARQEIFAIIKQQRAKYPDFHEFAGDLDNLYIELILADTAELYQKSDDSIVEKAKGFISKETKEVIAAKQREDMRENRYNPLVNHLFSTVKSQLGEDAPDDIDKWEVTDMLSNMRKYLREFVKGLPSEDEFNLAFKKIEDAFQAKVEFYGKAGKCQETNRLADFIRRLHATDEMEGYNMSMELKRKLARVKLLTRAMLLIMKYEGIKQAFFQWAYPYAESYLSQPIQNSIDFVKNVSGSYMSKLMNEEQVIEAAEECVKILEFLERKINNCSVSLAPQDAVWCTKCFPSDDPFFRWEHSKWGREMRDLFMGRPTKFTADVEKSATAMNKSAIKIDGSIDLRFVCKKGLEDEYQKELDKLMRHFVLEMTHSGTSIYKFNGQCHPIDGESILLLGKVNTGAVEMSHVPFDETNDARTKMVDCYVLSPYSVWTFRLKLASPENIKKKALFPELADKFAHLVDLELVGRGRFLGLVA